MRSSRRGLFLGHPTFAVTVVLATFLLGGGLGSGISQRFFRDYLDARPHFATALIVSLAIIWSLVWPLVGQDLHSASLALRGLVVILCTLPLAMSLGIPFPQALDFIGRSDRRQVAVAWSVNGLMTVVGSVVAVLLSITTGFTSILWLGCVAYLAATVLQMLMQRQGTI